MSDAHGVPPRSFPVTTSDVLTLQIGNKSLTGWQRVNVQRVPASTFNRSGGHDFTQQTADRIDT